MTLSKSLSLIGLGIIKFVVIVWEIVTYPLYAAIYRPWEFKDRNERVRAKIINETKDEDGNKESITIYSNPFNCDIREEILRKEKPVETLDRLMDFAFEKHGDKKCMGTRKILKEEKEPLKGFENASKFHTKYELGDYSWLSFKEVRVKCENFGKGMRHLGFKPKDKIVIYADTNAKWFIGAIGCFKSNFTVVTIYTNLGDDGVIYGLNQTDAKCIITSQELMPKLKNGILKAAVNIHTVIYIEKQTQKYKDDDENEVSSINIYSYDEVMNMGEVANDKTVLTGPGPDDIAVIMYTSGSTGNPKGALLSHKNICENIIAGCTYACNLTGGPKLRYCYMAYLPLAHIFELSMEIIMMMKGCPVGYSGPNTLTDTSTMVKPGQIGDARALRPTHMIAVPIILDRIYKGIQAKVEAKGLFFSLFFQYCYKYRSYWIQKGFDTPILNRLIFMKLKDILGGNINAIIGGGAPLSSEVHDFLQTVLCVKISQGYGLTESCGGISLSHHDDFHVGQVGYPLPNVYMKLVNWKEGGYTVEDKPNPRGEIHIGGHVIAMGYYNLPEKTAESFYIDENGMRWFMTGDIGELMSTGAFKIIDRKKDLVKLQMGEYVSLGKVESVWTVHPIIDFICVYGDSTKYSVVAIIVPDESKLRAFIEKDPSININISNLSFKNLCSNEQVNRFVLNLLTEHSKYKLEKFEIPKSVHLSDHPWTPDTGLVTAALKLKRRVIKDHFQDEIDEMYNK